MSTNQNEIPGAIKEPIKIISHRTFPSGGKLTKVMVGSDIAYVREATRTEESLSELNLPMKHTKQVLELCASPEAWNKVSKIIQLEDDQKREVVQSPEFNPFWAEAWLDTTHHAHDELCKGTYGVVCLTCEQRVDVDKAGDLVKQVAETERLKAWFLFLEGMFDDLPPEASEAVQKALLGASVS